MIGRNGERGSGISALAAQHDDDDDISEHKDYRNKLHLHLTKIFSGTNLVVIRF